MSNVVKQILFSKDEKRFREIDDLTRQFAVTYSGNPIIRESIFSVVENFARKNDVPVELMRYSFSDEELWAFTFLKQGTIFICINSELPMCKQFFATAHELYHIYCFAEDSNQNAIRSGSVLKAETVDEASGDMEELEANAFASLLLMPKNVVSEQMDLLGIDTKNIDLDAILIMMDCFAMPYKACVLRLFECGYIKEAEAKALYDYDVSKIDKRIQLTGKAKRWQLDGKGTEIFGSLFDNFYFNKEHGFLTQSRIKTDEEKIQSIKNKYHID